MSEANITRDEAQARSTLLATDRYRIHVDLSGRLPSGEALSDPDQRFVSTTTITFTAREAGQTHVDLIADSVLEASLDGQPLDHSSFTGERLPLEVSAGDHELTVTAICRYSREGTGLHRFVDPADDRVYTYTQFEVPDARRVFACFEQPDLKGRFTFSVTAPEDWTVVSNAAQVSPTPSGDGFARWDFAETEPLSTYITAIVAGEYHLVVDEGYHSELSGDVPMSVLCRQSLAEHLDVDRILATTKSGFAVFEEAFGHRYAFGSYDQIFVPEYNFGAMENAGCITFRDEYVFRSRVTAAALRSRDNTILHELAHMWFGDLVTMTWWDDLWLNESFAEWASHFAQSEIDDDPQDAWAEFCNKRKNWAYRQDQLPSTHPIAADMVDLVAVDQNFDGITYAKGASVLRQLVAYVGRDAFLSGVKDYFAAHAFGNTQLSDLLSALEKSSGRDLSGWSAEWLEVAGVNTMRAEFEVDDEDRFTSFAVVQTAPEDYPTLRSHRMAIGIYALNPTAEDSTAGDDGGHLSRVHRVEIDVTGARTEVAELVGVHRGDLVLPNDDDLTYTKIRLDERSLSTVVEHIHHLDSPLARALCWGAAWDMCRDAEMTAQDYVAMVLRGVGTESDLTAVQALLGQAITAAGSYTPRGEIRDSVRHSLEQGIARVLVAAEDGSDHQLSIVRALAAAATGPTGGAVLQGWLDGEEVPAGVKVDTGLRWHLITHLARLGLADQAAIEAELAADNTIAGREAAGAALASIPTAEAKAAAWQQLTVAEDMPNESYRQIAGHFFQVGQDELLDDYVEPYLEAARAINDGSGVWARRGVPLHKAFLTTAFPITAASDALVTRVAEWLADPELNDAVRRAVSERCDDAVRALRCQATSAAG